MLAFALVLALGATPVATWSFEEDDGGFAPAGDDLQWEWGAFSTEYGPLGGGTGARGWATHLDAPYFNDAPGALALPANDLSGMTRPMLTWLHWYDIADGDYAQLVLPDGLGGWFALAPVYGYPDGAGWVGRSDGWVREYADLTGVSDSSELAFYLFTDAAVQRPGWYIDEVALWDGDIAPPMLSELSALPDTEDIAGPYLITVRARDNAPLASVELHVRVDGQGETVYAMIDGADDLWSASTPGPGVSSATVEYRVRATDGENEAWLPDRGWASFRVRLPPPTGLRGPEGRVVDTVADLAWDPPDSAQAVLGYRVYRGEEAVADAEGPAAEVGLAGGGLDTYTVRAVYGAGEGDASEPLTLTVSLPEVTYLGPGSAWQGESVRLRIVGQYLLLREGALALELGEGVSVEEVEVESVDEARVTLGIASDAPMGLRDAVLRSGEVEVRVSDAFEVLDGAGRPRLVSLSPETLRQGDTASLTIASSAGFAELPIVDLGEGIVVESVHFADSQTITVDAVVGPTAPLGERGVRVDDGRRVQEGVSLTVRDYVPPPTGSCATAPGVAGWLGALAFIRRRRPRRGPPAGR